MEIGPTADQLSLRDVIRDALATHCPTALVRQAMTDVHASEPLWDIAVELGWTALAHRGSGDDDLGLRTLDLVLTLEECGAALAPAPLVTSVGMAAAPLRAAGDSSQTALREIAGGSVATLAVQAPDKRLPGAAMALRHDRIHGTAVNVPDAVRCAKLVTLCRGEDDTGVHVAVVGPTAMQVTPHDSVDPSRPLATVEVDGIPELLAPVDLETALAPALLAQAAELVGVAGAVLKLAVQHAKSRTQFGHAIGSFQGVKHALADNQVAVERARSLAYAAADVIDTHDAPPRRRWTAAALAKAAAGEAAIDCTRRAVQIFGALGQTWEHDAHLYLRRAWLGASQLGDSLALYHLEGRRYLRDAS